MKIRPSGRGSAFGAYNNIIRVHFGPATRLAAPASQLWARHTNASHGPRGTRSASAPGPARLAASLPSCLHCAISYLSPRAFPRLPIVVRLAVVVPTVVVDGPPLPRLFSDLHPPSPAFLLVWWYRSRLIGLAGSGGQRRLRLPWPNGTPAGPSVSKFLLSLFLSWQSGRKVMWLLC